MASILGGACAGELVSVAIVEQDAAGDASLTWSYPAVDPELEPVLVARCGLGGGHVSQNICVVAGPGRALLLLQFVCFC